MSTSTSSQDQFCCWSDISLPSLSGAHTFRYCLTFDSIRPLLFLAATTTSSGLSWRSYRNAIDAYYEAMASCVLWKCLETSAAVLTRHISVHHDDVTEFALWNGLINFRVPSARTSFLILIGEFGDICAAPMKITADWLVYEFACNLVHIAICFNVVVYLLLCLMLRLIGVPNYS